MVTEKQTQPQRKTFRAYAFNKISYAAVSTIVAVLGGVAYFTGVLPKSSPPPAPPVIPQQTKINLPNGAILIPGANGICHLHALDNSTGAILDYGVVDCSNAADNNSTAWRRATNSDVGTEVSKSFRHE
jgi:hypothetical protein